MKKQHPRDADGNLICEWCFGPIKQAGVGRPKLYCSASHRELAFRQRKLDRRIAEAVELDRKFRSTRPVSSTDERSSAPVSSVDETRSPAVSQQGAEVDPGPVESPRIQMGGGFGMLPMIPIVRRDREGD